jgi:NADH-quinone oxidoreductase subunit A
MCRVRHRQWAESRTRMSGESLRFGCFLLATALLTGIMLGGSALLGPRPGLRADPEPFESGIIPIQGTDIRFPIQFYLMAMFFVIFDLELIFVLAWAAAARAAGWAGYAGIILFLALLLVALAYLWRAGALDGGPRARPGRRP